MKKERPIYCSYDVCNTKFVFKTVIFMIQENVIKLYCYVATYFKLKSQKPWQVII